MRFWTHMFGNGVGILRVLIHDKEAGEDRVVWQLAGEAGNAWYFFLLILNIRIFNNLTLNS